MSLHSYNPWVGQPVRVEGPAPAAPAVGCISGRHSSVDPNYRALPGVESMRSIGRGGSWAGMLVSPGQSSTNVSMLVSRPIAGPFRVKRFWFAVNQFSISALIRPVICRGERTRTVTVSAMPAFTDVLDISNSSIAAFLGLAGFGSDPGPTFWPGLACVEQESQLAVLIYDNSIASPTWLWGFDYELLASQCDQG